MPKLCLENILNVMILPVLVKTGDKKEGWALLGVYVTLLTLTIWVSHQKSLVQAACQSSIVHFWWGCVNSSLTFTSQLTGGTLCVVFWGCSPSASRFDLFYVQGWSSVYLLLYRMLMAILLCPLASTRNFCQRNASHWLFSTFQKPYRLLCHMKNSNR